MSIDMDAVDLDELDFIGFGDDDDDELDFSTTAGIDWPSLVGVPCFFIARFLRRFTSTKDENGKEGGDPKNYYAVEGDILPIAGGSVVTPAGRWSSVIISGARIVPRDNPEGGPLLSRANVMPEPADPEDKTLGRIILGKKVPHPSGAVNEDGTPVMVYRRYLTVIVPGNDGQAKTLAAPTARDQADVKAYRKANRELFG